MAKKIENQCSMKGRNSAMWWEHGGRKRCTNVATWRAYNGALHCNACHEHLAAMARGAVNIAKMRVDYVRGSKRIANRNGVRRAR